MDQTELVKRVLDIALALDHASRTDDWPEATRLSAACAPLIRAITPEQTPDVLNMVRRVQEIHAVVFERAQNRQTELREAYRTAVEKVDSARAYLDGARL